MLAVDAELKRAQQVDEEERFYREALAGANRLEQIVGVFILAARRGDVDGLIQLNERFDRLQTGRALQPIELPHSGSWGRPRDGPGDECSCRQENVCRCSPSARLQPGDGPQEERTSVARRGRPSAPRSLSIPVGPGYIPTLHDLDRFRLPHDPDRVPQVNEYLDANVITVLRTAFELYKRDDLLSDLIGHYRRQAEAAPTPADAIYPRLALSSFLWWNDAEEEAIAELTKVVEASRAESDLRLDLAGLLEQQGDYAEALALVDARQPLDNFALRRREELALRVAQRVAMWNERGRPPSGCSACGWIPRPRLSLAPQMHQLGLHELAEAVLGRARRRRRQQGDRPGWPDASISATAKARRGRADRHADPPLDVNVAPVPTPASRLARKTPEAARSAALSFLARSGQLPRLIERANRRAQENPELNPDPPGPCRLLHGRPRPRQGPHRIEQDRPTATGRRQPAVTGRRTTGAGRTGKPRRSTTSRPLSRKTRRCSTRVSLLRIQAALLDAGKADELLAAHGSD